jgi:hypothetical protein
MNVSRRPLSEMLTDVFDAVVAARTGGAAVRASSIELTLPIEVWFDDAEDEPAFNADVPAWRWRTVFDQTPGRMNITWETGVSS